LDPQQPTVPPTGQGPLGPPPNPFDPQQPPVQQQTPPQPPVQQTQPQPPVQQQTPPQPPLQQTQPQPPVQQTPPQPPVQQTPPQPPVQQQTPPQPPVQQQTPPQPPVQQTPPQPPVQQTPPPPPPPTPVTLTTGVNTISPAQMGVGSGSVPDTVPNIGGSTYGNPPSGGWKIDNNMGSARGDIGVQDGKVVATNVQADPSLVDKTTPVRDPQGKVTGTRDLSPADQQTNANNMVKGSIDGWLNDKINSKLPPGTEVSDAKIVNGQTQVTVRPKPKAN
jgi:hypothetical protein